MTNRCILVTTSSSLAGVEGTPGLTHRVLRVAGGPVSVYAAGPRDAPTVVLLHGAMFDEARFSWDQLFPALSTAFHVVAIDLPRHGGSRPWQGRLDHTRLTAILSSVVEELHLTRFVLVGLSMGGGLAIEFAALHPDRVSSMVLFEPGGIGERLDHQFLTWVYVHLPGLGGAVSRLYANASQPKLRKLLESLYVGGAVPTDPERLVGILSAEIRGKRRYHENDLDDWQRCIIGPRQLRWNLLDLLPELTCATLWLRGADSTLVKQDEMERAVSLVESGSGSASLIVIPNAGHMLPLERPAEVNSCVLKFLGLHVERR